MKDRVMYVKMLHSREGMRMSVPEYCMFLGISQSAYWKYLHGHREIPKYIDKLIESVDSLHRKRKIRV